MLANTDRARDALQACDPECSRDEWVRLAMAAKSAGIDLDTFDAWNAQANTYRERDTWAVWQSIRRADGIGPATLFKAAAQAGWTPEGRTPRNMPPRAATKPAVPRREPRPGMGAADVWGRCRPATAEHGYIVTKQGSAAGLRVVPDGDRLTVAGQHVAGALVVPVLADGVPVSLQFIGAPEQSARWKAAGVAGKLNLPGALVAGVFIVGDLVAGGTAFVCEGIGQAWTCWKATGCASVVAFGWGRVRGVAADLRRRDASARLVLVPDMGKEDEAESIARDVGALFVTMPEGWPMNADVNDLAQRDGADMLEALLSSASAPAKPEPRFKLLNSADLHALPPLTWRVRGVLPAEGIASICGPSASGKSFLELDMAAAIAEGLDWFGYRVRASPVVLVCLEGAAGFRLRVAAWEKHNGRRLPAGLRLVLQPVKLTEPEDVEDMAAAVLSAGAGAVTFIDTLNASAPGVDENSSADMGRILDAAKELQARTDGLVVLVHHAGKDATKGMRGHSSLYAAMDAVVAVSRDGARKQWTTNPSHGGKSKDGADGEAHRFVLDVVELAPDAEGQPVTSCVVRIDGAAADVARVPVPQGENQRLVYDGIRGLFKDGPKGKPGAPSLRPCIELEAAVMAGAARLACPTDKRTSRARTAISGLVARGVLGLNEGWLWTV